MLNKKSTITLNFDIQQDNSLIPAQKNHFVYPDMSYEAVVGFESLLIELLEKLNTIAKARISSADENSTAKIAVSGKV